MADKPEPNSLSWLPDKSNSLQIKFQTLPLYKLLQTMLQQMAASNLECLSPRYLLLGKFSKDDDW